MDADLQYLRKCSLVVSGAAQGLDLSQMKIHFRTTQNDLNTPNHANIRVFNLSDDTARRVQKEYTDVTLQAGYETGAFGIIFKGTIKQVRRGRINATDTYLDILAADGDLAFTQGILNKTLAAGATAKDQMSVIAGGMKLPEGYVPDLPTGALSRGKVLFGMARDEATVVADTANADWSIQNGKLQVVDRKGYVPGEAVKITSSTGMVGLPEQTEEGIHVTCLLNPKIKIGSLVWLDNKSIQEFFLGGKLLYPDTGRLEDIPGFRPRISDDGFYRVYVCEHEGDTRDNPWYSKLTCLSIDRSAAPNKSVLAD